MSKNRLTIIGLNKISPLLYKHLPNIHDHITTAELDTYYSIVLTIPSDSIYIKLHRITILREIKSPLVGDEKYVHILFTNLDYTPTNTGTGQSAAIARPVGHLKDPLAFALDIRDQILKMNNVC